MVFAQPIADTGTLWDCPSAIVYLSSSMLTSLQREPSGQPAAVTAAKDRATVELVLQKVHCHPRLPLMYRMFLRSVTSSTVGYCSLAQQDVLHADHLWAARVLKKIESQLKVQARVSR